MAGVSGGITRLLLYCYRLISIDRRCNWQSNGQTAVCLADPVCQYIIESRLRSVSWTVTVADRTGQYRTVPDSTGQVTDACGYMYVH